MSEIENLLEQDADKGCLDETNLSKLTDLFQRLLTEQIRLESQEAAVKDTKDAIRKLSERDIPDLMEEIGLESFTLTTGETLKKQKYYSAKIPSALKGKAFAYLEETGNDAIIKEHFALDFGRGEQETERAAAVAWWLEENNIPFNAKTDVHPQTLKAFVKAQIEAGVDFPKDLFGVYVGNTVKVAGKKG